MSDADKTEKYMGNVPLMGTGELPTTSKEISNWSKWIWKERPRNNSPKREICYIICKHYRNQHYWGKDEAKMRKKCEAIELR